MTEIERYTQPTTEVDSWAPMMSDVIKLADYVSETEFVPKALRGKPPAIAASILAGREAGIPPMRALSHIHMVDGRPSMSAEQKRAQALSAGHEIVYVETTSTRCVVKGRRNGSEAWSTVSWTMDDAKQAGLAGKENWRKHPRRMLEARATGELCDMLFPDATAGLATFEEVQDGGDATGVETEGQTQPKPRTAQRRSQPKKQQGQQGEQGSVQAVGKKQAEAAPQATVPEPPLPGEEEKVETAAEYYERQPPRSDESDTDAGNGTEKPTAKQNSNVMRLFHDLGIDRAQRLNVGSAILGKRLSSFRELTKDDASALIDTLELAQQHDNPVAHLDQLITQTQTGETEQHGDVFDGEVVDDENEAARDEAAAEAQ